MKQEELNGFAARFIPQRSSFIPSKWPDSGLTRNTRCRCYRCSVPGLAGFTRRALCGARSLIKDHWQLSIADSWLSIDAINKQLNVSLSLSEHAQQTVDCQMQ